MRISRRTGLLAVMFLSSLAALGVTQSDVIVGQASAGPLTLIIDNKDPGYFINNFTVSNSPRGFRRGVAFFYPYSYGSANAFGASTFRFDNVPPGTYKAYATWPAHIQNNTQVRIRVIPNGLGQGADVTVNQRLTPSSIQYEGVGWHYLGNVVTSMNSEQVSFDIFAGPNEATLADAVMLQEVMLPPVCGNGRREGEEQCDDGNDDPNDGCYYGCQLNRCGDNRITQQLGEQCDDGNTVNSDGCSSSCQNEPARFCGNGIMEAGEQCDDGNQVQNDSCSSNCRLARCGDEVVQQGEQCDDGNASNSDSCRNDCTRPSSSGHNPANALDVNADGRISVKDYNAIKDHLDTVGSGTAPAGPPYLDTNNDGFVSPIDSLLIINWLNANATCGDGNTTSPEQCDDDNTVNNDACTNACRNPRCGDQIVQQSEQCDDGNQNNADSCNNSCQIISAPACGNGTVEGSEQCDDGNTAIGDGCSEVCRREPPPARPYCGNGTVDPDEQCDDGNGKHGDGCSPLCKTEVCGDNIVNNRGIEECDTGGRVGTVGQSMPRVSCNTQCSYDFCGDGVVQEYNLEQCDDGNRRAGDGCDHVCHTEHAAAPELSIRTTVPATIMAGANVDYLFQVTNHGSEEVENVTLTMHFFQGDSAFNRIPSPLSLVSARFGNGESLSCEYVAAQKFIRCTVPVIGDGSTRSIVITLHASANQYCGQTLRHQANLALGGYPGSLASIQGQTNVRCESAACRYPALLQSAWQNRPNPLDVNGNGRVEQLDAYLIIWEISARGSNLQLPTHRPNTDPPQPFFDVDGNMFVTARDSLLVANYLNQCIQE